jgi:hypothetical protein
VSLAYYSEHVTQRSRGGQSNIFVVVIVVASLSTGWFFATPGKLCSNMHHV